MKEVWVKKTVWRRYLIESDNEKAVSTILSTDDRGDELVQELYDTSPSCEYDQEVPVKPIEFEIKDI